ncbi:hypothetical protein [Pseudoclavibacter helvolus]|uniref:hypothetical protein n=1 Tax=Pseudoclavibacter helvolus TaxID=255205 RepID=UPI0024ACF829|nr:hypothetical protein [Pseudoclavibacter helvolus]
MQRNAFVLLTGQDDNVGDVVLRRRFLRALADGAKTHVYVRTSSPGFVESLTHGLDVEIYRDRNEWARKCLTGVLRRGWVYAHNPGEIQCRFNLTRWNIPLIPLFAFARLRGNKVFSIGMGTRDDTKPWRYLWSAVARLSNVTIWRDSWSSQVFGTGETGPDWAFDERLEEVALGQERGTLLLSYRFDRASPSADFVAAVRRVANARGLRPVVLSQVLRDNAPAKALADRLGCDAIVWEDGVSHLDHELIVRRAMAESEACISDRIHVLIMGLTEGSIPIGLMEHEDIKAGRHFVAAGMEGVSANATGWTSDQMSGFLEQRLDQPREEQEALWKRAASEVASYTGRMFPNG